jgi:hypothetical protein
MLRRAEDLCRIGCGESVLGREGGDHIGDRQTGRSRASPRSVGQSKARFGGRRAGVGVAAVLTRRGYDPNRWTVSRSPPVTAGG